jgi:hypothetical protein
MFEYLDKDESGSAEIFTTDSLNDKEQNVRIGFPLGAFSFFLSIVQKTYDSLIYTVVQLWRAALS